MTVPDFNKLPNVKKTVCISVLVYLTEDMSFNVTRQGTTEEKLISRDCCLSFRDKGTHGVWYRHRGANDYLDKILQFLMKQKLRLQAAREFLVCAINSLSKSSNSRASDSKM